MHKNSNILLVGMGLLGGSYAKALQNNGFCRVFGIDQNPDSIALALQKGYIQGGASADFAPLVQAADIVIFSLYPTAFVQWVQQYGQLLKPGCLCTDVCGVKQTVVQAVQQCLPSGVEFIASHPMAGKEVSGVANSHLVQFAGANFLITPTEKNTQNGIAFARQLAQTLGFAQIVVLTPQQHDQMIAYVSQLTHAIAVCLMCAPDAAQYAAVTGDSFRDLTRIANINAPLWAELFLCNRHNLAAEMDGFVARLQQMREALLQGDRAALEGMMQASTAARRAFDQKSD